MRYPLLRFVGVLIQLFSVIAVFVVIVMFVSELSAAQDFSTAINTLGSSGRDALQALEELEAIYQSFGIPIDLPSRADLPIEPILINTANSFWVKPFLTLFFGLFGCLLAFAFGGVVGMLADIAAPITRVDFARFSQIDDGDPVTPKAWASFPPSQFDRKRGSVGDERKRQQRRKWDVGK